MKVLWLAHEGLMSGANLCLLEYIDILQKKGFENHLIVPSVRELASAAARKNIPFTEVKFYSWTVPYADYKFSLPAKFKRWARNKIAVTKISKLILSVKPDFIVTNTITTPVAAYAAKLTRVKHIWFVHEFGEEDHGFSIIGGFKKGAQIMRDLSQRLVYNSSILKEKYKTIVPENKSSIVYNAVMINSQTPPVTTNDTFSLLILGQVAPSKNHVEAFKALKICKEKGLKLRLTVAGKAEDMDYLRSLLEIVRSFGLENEVKFIGHVLRPAELIQQHEVLLMCSKMEAFGRVTVEALKLGVPVIAADKGGSLEIIESGVDGYLYESGNEFDFAQKILELKNNYGQFNAKQISVKARQKFNEEVSYKQLLQVFG